MDERRSRLTASIPSAEGRLVLEVVYTALLVATFLFVAWFSVYVVYKLYTGQK